MNTKEIIDFYKHATDDELFREADRVCRRNYGDAVYLRGLIEFSNYCSMNCHYCGIRSDNSEVNRFRLSIEEIASIVENGYKAGLKTFVLQSGEDPYYNGERLSELIQEIKRLTEGKAAVTLSCGILSKDEFKRIKDAGCDRYLMRFEVSDPEIHSRLREGLTLENRINTLMLLKDLGFETGSGYMVGLPDETEEIRINNALLCHNLGLEMVGVGPFIPHDLTPLKDAEEATIDLAVRATALLRLLLPRANIPATTAAGTIDSKGREKMLAAGANVLMPNITPVKNKKDYLLYPGKICIDESGFECIGCLTGRVGTIGKKIDMGRGDSLVKMHNAG